jgi:hypothetical protein
VSSRCQTSGSTTSRGIAPAGPLALIVLQGAMVVPPPPTVSVESRTEHAFTLSRLCGVGRWFREVGYTVPILSQDARFDETWSCETCDREFGAALLHERAVRASIERLRELGCESVRHSGRRLTATLARHPHSLGGKEHKAAVRAELGVLGDEIGRLCKRRSFPHEGRRGLTGTVLVTLCVLLTAGLGGLAAGNDLMVGELGRLALRSLLFSVPLLLLVALAMALLLAGRSAAHKELGIVVLLAALALPTLGVGTATYLNRVLDDGAATLRRLPVLELQERHGEGNKRSHYAIVPSWREDRGPTTRIKLSREMAAKIVPGSTVLSVTTSPGKLDAERLLSVMVNDFPR